MDAFSAAVVFVIAWWIVFFMVLPIGVRSQVEEKSVIPGTEPGAPAVPDLGRKALWALGGASIITAMAWVVVNAVRG